jgi:hypothetical protein
VDGVALDCQYHDVYNSSVKVRILLCLVRLKLTHETGLAPEKSVRQGPDPV